MRPGRFLIGCLMLALLLLPGFALGEAEQVEEEKKTVLEEIIQLVVENNPTLQLQKNFISEIQQMPEPGADLPDFVKLRTGSKAEGTDVPLLSLSQIEDIRSRILARKKMLAEARQTYQNLKKSLISELLTRISDISKLQNTRKNLSQLKSFLEERELSLRKQVKAGVEDPAALFDLTERIMNTSVKIENTITELEISRLEVAINLGGEKWSQLLNLLNKI